jgi:hypothetical protein
MTEQSKNRLSLTAIMALPEWQLLTSQQQTFLGKFLASGLSTGEYNALSAVKTAYRVSEKNAPSLASHLLGQRKVRRLLDLHFGRSPVDSMLEDLEKSIQKSLRTDRKNGRLRTSTVKAASLLVRYAKKATDAELETSTAGLDSPEAPQAFPIGAVITQDGKKYRVVAEEIQ